MIIWSDNSDFTVRGLIMTGQNCSIESEVKDFMNLKFLETWLVSSTTILNFLEIHSNDKWTCSRSSRKFSLQRAQLRIIRLKMTLMIGSNGFWLVPKHPWFFRRDEPDQFWRTHFDDRSVLFQRKLAGSYRKYLSAMSLVNPYTARLISGKPIHTNCMSSRSVL